MVNAHKPSRDSFSLLISALTARCPSSLKRASCLRALGSSSCISLEVSTIEEKNAKVPSIVRRRLFAKLQISVTSIVINRIHFRE